LHFNVGSAGTVLHTPSGRELAKGVTADFTLGALQELLELRILPNCLENLVVPTVQLLWLHVMVLFAEQKLVPIATKLGFQIATQSNKTTEVVTHCSEDPLVGAVALIQYFLAPVNFHL
jgi:hypothetical protein